MLKNRLVGSENGYRRNRWGARWRGSKFSLVIAEHKKSTGENFVFFREKVDFPAKIPMACRAAGSGLHHQNECKKWYN